MKNKKIISLITALAVIGPFGVFAQEPTDTEVIGTVTESVDGNEADTSDEERDVLANIISKDVRNVMANTVMIQPNSAYGFVFGRKTAVGENEDVVVYQKGNDIFAPSEFLKSAFPESNVTDDKFCNVYEFAGSNGLKVSTVNDTTYISKDFNVSGNISAMVNKFFGIYVKNGSSGSGTFDNPIGSLAEAKSMISEVKKSIGLPDGGITVYFREGIYSVTDTVSFMAEDSGADGSPITYKAYKDETVRFNGGISIKGSEFKEVTDKKMLTRLPDPDKVVCVDISSKLSGFPTSFKTSDPIEWNLSYRDESLKLARWPNRGFALTSDVLECDIPNYRTVGFRFVVDDFRMKKWVGEEDPRMFGYFCWTWLGEYRKIADIRPSDMSVKTDVGSSSGVLKGKQYYVYNIVSELDTAGEYYFDTKTNMLYFYPVEGDKTSKTFLENDVQFALLSQNMFNLYNCENVTFDGIAFENALGMVFDMNEECRNVTYKGCTFRNIANGIMQKGYNNTITGCDFYNITVRPIDMQGGDRNTLTNSESTVQNCKFWNFNTVKRTNTGAIRLYGCGDVVSHNEFAGGPHSVIALGGNENIIEYNEFYDSMKDKAHDAGPIYGGRNLSSQMNIIRYNYIHDIYEECMGSVYLDDDLSNHHIYDNVFINVSRAVFVHGGVSNTVKRNLVMNAKDGVGVRTCGTTEYWISSNTQTQASNNFMWNLVNLPYKSKPWQRYNDVFRHIDAHIGEVVPPYDCEFTDNTFVNLKRGDDELTEGIEAIAKAVSDVVTIKNNEVISGEEAKNFVIPDNYQKIMDNAGIYTDEDRKTLDKIGSFDLLRPYNKEENVEGSEVEFEWTVSENANSYLFTLATDKEFKNIISNKYVETNHVTIERLNYHNTRYYWRVTAVPKKTNSMISDERIKSNQEYYSFTTKAVEKIDTSKLIDIIETCKGKLESVVEGDNPGDYKSGTKDLMVSLIDDYTKRAAADTITQRDVNEMSENLNSEFTVLFNRRNMAYTDMKELLSRPSYWTITPNQFIVGEGYLKHTVISGGRFGTAEKIPPHEIVKFNAIISEFGNSWVGFGLRAQASPDGPAWGGNSQYLVIIKPDIIEFQKFGANNALIEYPNTYVKPGEKHEYEFGAVNQDDGTVIVTFKIDGEVIAEYHDETNPITDGGFFEVYGAAKDTYIELMAE